jgi:hypothetical protein
MVRDRVGGIGGPPLGALCSRRVCATHSYPWSGNWPVEQMHKAVTKAANPVFWEIMHLLQQGAPISFAARGFVESFLVHILVSMVGNRCVEMARMRVVLLVGCV